jgi:hypothetical protein
MIHERIVELITQVHKKVFDKTEPGKIVELFKLGEGSPPQLGIAVHEIIEGFFSFLGFPRLMTTTAIRKGIGKGVAEGHFRLRDRTETIPFSGWKIRGRGQQGPIQGSARRRRN